MYGNFIIFNLKTKVQNAINNVKENNKIAQQPDENNHRGKEVSFGWRNVLMV